MNQLKGNVAEKSRNNHVEQYVRIMVLLVMMTFPFFSIPVKKVSPMSVMK